MITNRYTMIGAIVLATSVPMMARAGTGAKPIAGKWLTENGEALVEIAPCGKALCGKVIKVMKPKAGERPTLGVSILTELVDSGDNWKGKILDPRSGKTYKAKVAAHSDGTLKVEGCVAFVCRGPVWTKAR